MLHRHPAEQSARLPAVLAVDPEMIVLKLIRAALQLRGIPVFCATSSEEALKILWGRREQISVALIELMPDLGGLSLPQALLRVKPTLRLGIMSGSRVPERINPLTPGIGRILLKPFSLSDLIECVSSLHQETLTWGPVAG